MCLLISDFNQLTKRRSHNYEDKSCMKVLSEKFLENSGLLDNIEDTKNKVIILRISKLFILFVFLLECFSFSQKNFRTALKYLL